jgi:hypothetical protein
MTDPEAAYFKQYIHIGLPLGLTLYFYRINLPVMKKCVFIPEAWSKSAELSVLK